MMIKLEHLFILSAVWITLSSIYLYRKQVFAKKTNVVTIINNENLNRDIINYPKPFSISFVFNSNETPDPVIISDWVVKYNDLISNNYSVPLLKNEKASTSNKEIISGQENPLAEITSEDIDKLDIPELSKGLFESLSEKDYEEPQDLHKINNSNNENDEGDNYEAVSNINSEF